MELIRRHICLLIVLCLLCGRGPVANAQLSFQPLDSNWVLQDSAKIAEDGSALSAPSYVPSGWHKATVPGTILTSLVDDGVYPDPLYGENNRPNIIPDSLCRTSYWYRTVFSPPTGDAREHIWLNFDGINYNAVVWVDGHRVGEIDGAFARGTFDITPLITYGRRNAIAVQVLPPPDPGVPLEQTVSAGVGKNGGILAEDGPTFLCTIGWDWIPGIRDRDMGLWQRVSLSTSGPVTIKDTYVTSTLPLPKVDSADLSVETTLVNVTSSPEPGRLVGTFAPGKTFVWPVTLVPEETRKIDLTPVQSPILHVAHPRLWWPNGYGQQNLYTLHLKFVQSDRVSDYNDTSFGIRQISYSVPNSNNLTISVNGVPVICKGGDWGMDEAMKREPYKRLDAQIRMHKLANYTIIRNWVGQSTSADFYSLCDKYGIMVWDEFFQPNPGDGPNPNDDAMYLANVKEKILRFRSHPSIVLWCGRNEGLPPPTIDFGIRKLMNEYDPVRLYQPSSASGRGVNSHGPYLWRAPRDYYTFDEAFKTEIGSVSIPTLQSIEGMMPEKDWNVINDDWAEHDLAAGAQAGNVYPFVMAQRYGPISNLADFARKGQMMNYEAFRAMYEGRNAELFNPVTGVITWMSNPAQPSFVWQLYSWDLEPNASLFAARKACEPIHIQMNQTNWHVMVINNTPVKLSSLTVKEAVYNMDGSSVYAGSSTVDAGPSVATDDGVVPFPTGLTPVHFVKLQLFDSRHKLLSDNFYWCGINEDDLTDLAKLPIVALDAGVVQRNQGQNLDFAVTLTNQSKWPAIMAHIQLRGRRSNKRVLPVFYDDNYVSLLPGESKTIHVEADKSDLHGDSPVIMVDGWNVSVKPNAGVLPDTDAIVTATAAPPEPTSTAPTDTVRYFCGADSPRQNYYFGQSNSELSKRMDGFVAEQHVVGGAVDLASVAVNTSARDTAPMWVYQSERWGACTYTVPVKPGEPYQVRLHFAENSFDQVGARLFNVDINGQRVLTNFDIFAAAGGESIAVVKKFENITPNADGNIIISFTKGAADEPKIDGIEIIGETP